MSIHIRPGVLGLAGSEKDVGDKLIDLTNELEIRVVRKVLQGKFALSSVSRVLSY
jgi:hypothetical protein